MKSNTHTLPTTTPPKTLKPFFSIVIPTLNEEKYLPSLLRDLSKQSCSDFEVIHVDGSSEDKTVIKAKAFEKKLPLQTITVTTRNVSFQRNKGIKHARGEWIIFMDADNRLPPYFLDGIKYRIARDPHFSVFAPWTVAETDARLDKAVTRYFNFAMELCIILNKPAAFGACIGVKRSLTKKVQFDERQKVLEDNIFLQNAIKQGATFKLLRDPGYVYSLRRLKKEGTLKLAAQGANLNLRYFQNKGFEDDNFGYVMEGGSYYDQKNPSIFTQIQSMLKQASEKQLDQAKKIVALLKDM